MYLVVKDAYGSPKHTLGQMSRMAKPARYHNIAVLMKPIGEARSEAYVYRVVM